MAVTALTFLAEFPEFAAVDSGVLSAELSNAVTLCPEAVWGDLQDMGIKLQTAVWLAQRPNARDMQLAPDGMTVYSGRLDTLKRIISSGGRVI